MTERGRSALARDRTTLSIGPSRMRWDGDALTIEIDERAAPLPFALRGTVRVMPRALTQITAPLDAAGLHRWSPLAPASRVEVALISPALRWSGDGYFDSNAGDGPLEESFSDWTWSRAETGDTTTIFYDVVRRDGTGKNLALRIDRHGEVGEIDAPPVVELPKTLWRMRRPTRADDGASVTVAETLTDAPFYARSVLKTRIFGESTTAMHESLSLDRFMNPVVQAMLPFRTPRAWR